MIHTQNISKLIDCFAAPQRDTDKWIDEIASYYAPPDRVLMDTIRDLERLLAERSDDELQEIWRTAGGRVIFSEVSGVRWFLEKTLAALRRVAEGAVRP